MENISNNIFKYRARNEEILKELGLDKVVGICDSDEKWLSCSDDSMSSLLVYIDFEFKTVTITSIELNDTSHVSTFNRKEVEKILASYTV